ncbi:hypothetical protein [Streptomyces sp. NPDC001601]|uniref:hypothetical protein n=1 Tax=Streptomyces sp. NPDC001601 TaxID=3364592 RepID=UPI0036B6BB13
MSRTNAVRILAGATLAATMFAGTVLAGAGSAYAATNLNGHLESGEFGLYYNSGGLGCVRDSFYDDNTFVGDNFKDPSGVNCAGEGQTTNDNTASYWNRDAYQWEVDTDAYRSGIKGWIPAGYSGDASSNFKNEISSNYIDW